MNNQEQKNVFRKEGFYWVIEYMGDKWSVAEWYRNANSGYWKYTGTDHTHTPYEINENQIHLPNN